MFPRLGFESGHEQSPIPAGQFDSRLLYGSLGLFRKFRIPIKSHSFGSVWLNPNSNRINLYRPNDAYLPSVIARIADYPARRINELLPWSISCRSHLEITNAASNLRHPIAEPMREIQLRPCLNCACTAGVHRDYHTSGFFAQCLNAFEDDPKLHCPSPSTPSLTTPFMAGIAWNESNRPTPAPAEDASAL